MFAVFAPASEQQGQYQEQQYGQPHIINTEHQRVVRTDIRLQTLSDNPASDIRHDDPMRVQIPERPDYNQTNDPVPPSVEPGRIDDVIIEQEYDRNAEDRIDKYRRKLVVVGRIILQGIVPALQMVEKFLPINIQPVKEIEEVHSANYLISRVIRA